MRWVLFLLFAATAYGEPCTTRTPACAERIVLTPGSPSLMVYRSFALDVKNEGITRALVIVHGGGQNAANSFRTGLAAAFLAGALDNALVIAPRFASNAGGVGNSSGGGCRDTMAPEEVNWTCDESQPDNWRNGGRALGQHSITSYDFIDKLMQELARKNVFP